MHRTALFFLLVLFCGSANQHAQAVPLGIWSWSQQAITTQTARKELLAFCKAEGITHIDQHVSVRRVGDVFQIQNADKLTKLLVEAAAEGISVAALRGDKTMFFAKNHQDQIDTVTALVAFNRQLPQGVSLQGIKFDVEPYLTAEWKAGGVSRETVLRDYLSCLDKINRSMTRSLTRSINQSVNQNDSTMQLSVDVPFWWDKAEFALEYGGTKQAFVHHIQDRVDSIALMSYRRTAKDVLRLSAQELAHSSQHPQSVSVGLNFNDEKGVEQITTFASHSPALYRNTLAELQTALATNAAADRIMLHDYNSLSKFLSAKSTSSDK